MEAMIGQKKCRYNVLNMGEIIAVLLPPADELESYAPGIGVILARGVRIRTHCPRRSALTFAKITVEKFP